LSGRHLAAVEEVLLAEGPHRRGGAGAEILADRVAVESLECVADMNLEADRQISAAAVLEAAVGLEGQVIYVILFAYYR
jgi:hypothetical protein